MEEVVLLGLVTYSSQHAIPRRSLSVKLIARGIRCIVPFNILNTKDAAKDRKQLRANRDILRLGYIVLDRIRHNE